MNRIDELDRAPFERGQRDSIVKIANWWFDRLGPKSRDKYAFREFLREKFGFTAKRCVECDKWKPDYDYPLAKNTKDGRMDYCRACEAVKKAAYRQRNLDRARARQREHYHANRERFKVYRKAWRKRKTKQEVHVSNNLYITRAERS